MGASIHAPSQGGDSFLTRYASTPNRFNPRPLTRGRPHSPNKSAIEQTLQSTPPHKGATRKGCFYAQSRAASIHAPSQGGDDEFV